LPPRPNRRRDLVSTRLDLFSISPPRAKRVAVSVEHLCNVVTTDIAACSLDRRASDAHPTGPACPSWHGRLARGVRTRTLAV